MKIVVTGTRGIPNIMGGVETHCEELFPRIAANVIVIYRKSSLQDELKKYKEQKLEDIEKCPQNSRMIGTVSPVMHKYIKHPMKWALKNKLRRMQGNDACLDKRWYDVGQDPIQGDLRDKF